MSNINAWIKNFKNKLEDSWDTGYDSEHPSCPCCKNTMEFYGHDENGDFPIGEGYWECHSCGYKITEDEL